MKAVNRVCSVFLRAVLRRMKELGLSQSALAVRMQASRPYVVKVLHGDVNITLETAARFAQALEMDFVPLLAPRQEGKCGKFETFENCKKLEPAPLLAPKPQLHVA